VEIFPTRNKTQILVAPRTRFFLNDPRGGGFSLRAGRRLLGGSQPLAGLDTPPGGGVESALRKALPLGDCVKEMLRQEGGGAYVPPLPLSGEMVAANFVGVTDDTRFPQNPLGEYQGMQMGTSKKDAM